jgi:hypothetical protein
MFMSNKAPERRTLADIIMERFQEAARAKNETGQTEKDAEFVPPGLNPKVVQVYKK